MGDVAKFPGDRHSGSIPTGGGNPPGLEARVAKVEASVEHIQQDTSEIKTDLRNLLKMIIGAFLIIGTMLVAGYFRLSDRIDTVATRMDSKADLILQRLPVGSTSPSRKP